MKKIVVFTLLFVTTTPLFAQSNQDRRLDSLKQVLSKEKTDTGKVQLLTQIGSMYGYGAGIENDDSSRKYAQQALQLSKKTGYTKGEIDARLVMVGYFTRTGNYPEALQMALENSKKLELAGDSTELFGQMMSFVEIYINIGNYKFSLHYGEKLRELVNSGIFKDSSTINWYNQVVNLRLGNIYSELQQPDSALHYWLLCYKNGFKEKQGAGWVALSANNIGFFYAEKGEDSLAFSYFKICIPYAKKAGRIDLMAYAKMGIARLFYKNRQSDSAFYYTRQALTDIKNTNVTDVSMEAYQLLSKLYNSRQQYDSAYKYLQNYVVLNDSLNNQTKIAQAQNLSFNETLQQQQLEQTKKEAQRRYETRLKIYILAAIILICLLIAFFLLRNIRNKRKANILLGKQKEEIQSTLSNLKSTQAQLIQSEKMASLGELTAGIAHEIQNPLNFVNNFSDVNKELLAEMKDEMDKGNANDAKAIANDVIENEEKINHHGKRADAIVKGMLQHSRVSSGVKEPTDINALCDEYLRLSYHGLRAKDKSFNATMKTDFDTSIGKINIVAQDIGRVILNLINNAFYAVNQRRNEFIKEVTPFQKVSPLYEPTVSVTTKKSDSHVLITVSDNGNGVPQNIVDKIFQPFFTTKPTGQGTGLGLSLSYDIVKAYGGDIKVESKEDEGSEFTILLQTHNS